MSSTSEPPDPRPILDGLKDFQRLTVDYAFERLYGDDSSTTRFLVADEVGLGKTLVARGLIGRTIEHLWNDVERIDIVYICSNADIARQNIARLRVTDEQAFARPTRMTLLPRTLHNLRSNKLNFVALTPATSFDPRSSMGIAEERAVLYLMLREVWDLGKGKAPLNLLRGACKRKSFADTIRWVGSVDDLDTELTERFYTDLETHDEAARTEGEVGLRHRFEELMGDFSRHRRRWPEKQRCLQRHLIADLRRLLGRTCVTALEPDLLILDEFQRFRSLLSGESEARELAELLFDYRDDATGNSARTVLLSATPYKAFTTRQTDPDQDHYRDFLATLDFLLPNSETTESLKGHLTGLRRELLRGTETSVTRLREHRDGIQQILRSVMVRTERLAATPDRDGMLREVAQSGIDLQTTDVAGYLGTRAIAREINHPDIMEYWKSAPWLLSLMDHYKLKRDVARSLEEGRPGVAEAVAADRDRDRPAALLPWDEIGRWQQLDPANPRLRGLITELLDDHQLWRLLWLPPSLPYWQLADPFRAARESSVTKRLVFSSWQVVPKAIALILSYEAERRMTIEYGQHEKNTPEERSRRTPLLTLARSDGRLTGMPVLGLMYPSFSLVEYIDPATDGHSFTRERTVESAVRQAADTLREELAPLTVDAPTTGPEDEAWYWAAPILLDARRDQRSTRKWLIAKDLPTAWPGVESDRIDADSRWAEHVREAAEIIDHPGSLGRPPADLAEAVARLALGGPGTTALRSLTRVAGGSPRDPHIRRAAAGIGWSFRTLFNLPEVIDLIRASDRWDVDTYWRRVVRYCIDGCLPAVLDEYAHVLREALGHVGHTDPAELAGSVSEAVQHAIGIRTTRHSVDVAPPSENGDVELAREHMRARFALRFGDQQSDDRSHAARADQVRGAFNSPFWPFVLASTSVGQEGLDFHLYCHAIVHWNVPGNPVDLEQREGRIHRFKGHAVRKNLAAKHGMEALGTNSADPWTSMFELGRAARPADANDLEPFWVCDGDAKIERHVPTLPLSRDTQRHARIREAVALYRMVFGQPRQEDLLDFLAERVPKEQRDELAESLAIELSPS